MEKTADSNRIGPHEILKQYWGFDSFRPLQESIVHWALQGKDSLVLLPTGGGKSLCFQVPAMCLPGLCIVVSPLIALMNDQVNNLKKKGINAIAINSSMSSGEIDHALDNAAYGDVKFLYVAPERLQTDLFQQRLKKMKVSLIAVDEAHCISEWGYDFRPAYLQIVLLRQLIPQVPVMALTATATPEVVSDIVDKLQLQEHNIFQSSFTRSNLSYVVMAEEDKYSKLVEILNKTTGSTIVYAGTRKGTKQLADFLRSKNITADCYHAGLDTARRSEIQKEWMQNKIRVIVATNAFGMGIDKPDVRFVVHMDIPAHPEAYFQEAGRTGRDGKRAYAILLHDGSDLPALRERTEKQFPEIIEIRQVYQALANYYQIATGAAANKPYIFNLSALCSRYKLNAINTIYAIKFLEQSNYISVSDAVYAPSKVQFLMTDSNLYRFTVEHSALEDIVQVLLRSYSGLFDHLKAVNEYELASRLKTDVGHVKTLLNRLVNFNVIEYVPANDKPYIMFVQPRLEAKSIRIDKEFYARRKKNAFSKLAAMEAYVGNDLICRSRILVNYFGEKNAPACGICDVCIARKNSRISNAAYKKTADRIVAVLQVNPAGIEQLLDATKEKKGRLLEILRWMMDAGELEYEHETQRLLLRKKHKTKQENT